MQNYEIQEKIYESKLKIIHKVSNIKDNNIYAIKDRFQIFCKVFQVINFKQFKCIKPKEVFRLDDNIIIIMEYQIKEIENKKIRYVIKFQILKLYYYIKKKLGFMIFGIDNLIWHQKSCYKPTELLFYNKFSYKSMIYQFGLVLFELTTQRQLFKLEIIEQIKAVILNGGAIVKIPQIYSKELGFIISTCLDLRETDRLDIRQLVNNDNFIILLKQKNFTFNYEQLDTFEFWCNNKQQKQKERVFILIIQNQKLKNLILIINKLFNKINQITIKQSIYELKINFLINQRNLIYYDYQKQYLRQIKIHLLYSSKISFSNSQKPQYLDAPIKPQNAINNSIKLKMEQCVEAIGIQETRQTLNRLRQGGSVNEFLSKYQNSKHHCIARHMYDIISFTQL
ncbi:unnamed protein product [Paramecium primaurelia]|uniref:Serine-threonine/tyrosine-protein kinase catalytic domain-containing protein n=1 Tax=Paramecium primaurelia TaxID=5886 RepID=A0A8S1M3Z9_PARPR|nr:unnamed protein product [Paramecium primaurelia]